MSNPAFKWPTLGDRVRTWEGDCRTVLPTLDQQFHACVTDPPYHLTSGNAVYDLPHTSAGNPRNRRSPSGGFMGKTWDGGDVAFQPGAWRAVYDRLLPGAYLVAFASTRGYHRMVCAIEDAGFIIHPMLAWVFGSGFPKGADASKAIDKHLGKEREVVGKASRCVGPSQKAGYRETSTFRESADNPGNLETAPATPEAAQWSGWKYGLQSMKPAIEPICLAQKPMEGNGAENLLKHGVGALNIDACRIPADETLGRINHTTSKFIDSANGSREAHERHILVDNSKGLGRYPANLIHDGSPEVMEAFAACGTSVTGKRTEQSRTAEVAGTNWLPNNHKSQEYTDAGTAARFFYSAKADAADRADSKHPTVKPVDLIRYLVQLVTPPGGHVLDPFAGTGTTGEACMLLGFDCTLIEKDPGHANDIRHRIKRWSGGDTPLFAEVS